jgi:hypothetical protein
MFIRLHLSRLSYRCIGAVTLSACSDASARYLLNRVGDSSRWRTVCRIFLWPDECDCSI